MRERNDRVEPTFGASDPASDTLLSDRSSGARRHRPERPLLVSVLVALLFVGGAGMFFLPLIAYPVVVSMAALAGISAYALVGTWMAMGFVSMVGSVGAWEGMRWSWALVVFELIVGFAVGVQKLDAGASAVVFDDITRQHVLLAATTIGIHAACIAYFLGPSVRRYFGLTLAGAVQRLVLATGVLVILILAMRSVPVGGA